MTNAIHLNNSVTLRELAEIKTLPTLTKEYLIGTDGNMKSISDTNITPLICKNGTHMVSMYL